MKKILILITILFGLLLLFMVSSRLYTSLPKLPIWKYYIIIYGNTVFSDGTPSSRLQARLDAGKELYDKGIVSKIIVSGGVDSNRNDEAKVMKDYLVKKGIDKDIIITDSKGDTTRGTSENAYNIISNREVNMSQVGIIGVSQYFHIPRVKLSLQQAGFQNVYGYAPRYMEARDIYSIFRELAAYIKYYLIY